MPNWCRNSIAISHNNPAMIERLANAAEAPLQEFIPCPFDPEKDQQWYDWRVNNWGTKWDIELNDVTVGTHFDGSGKTLYAEFDSAWSPPIEAYNKLCELGFVITAMYKELGMMFAGIYDSDGEENIETRIDFDDAEWRDKMPEQLSEFLEPDYQNYLEHVNEQGE